jgi:hypothetical protein
MSQKWICKEGKMVGKKLLLKNRANFLILVLIFAVSVLFTTCGGIGDEAPTSNLWEQLRNTAWTIKTETIEPGFWTGFYDNPDIAYKPRGTYTHTIGFYGPKNGPLASSIENASRFIPYFIVHTVFEGVYRWYDWDSTNNTWIYSHEEEKTETSYSRSRLEINRSGNQIHLDQVSSYFSDSFGIFISGDKLIVSDFYSSSEWWYFDYGGFGTYTKISSDPNYDWGEITDDPWWLQFSQQ